MESIGNLWLYLVFFAIVAVMLAIDFLGFKQKEGESVKVKTAAYCSIACVSVAALFGGGLWLYLKHNVGLEVANTKVMEYFAGYLLEKSLAIDNVFVWMMIFSFFAVPLELQRRVLLYGIVGAIVLRTVMIFVGSWLINEFHWLLYIFGAFLIVTGIKMAWFSEHDPNLEKNPFVRWLRNHYPVTEKLEGERFFVMRDGVRMMTPLFLALVLVEISDVIFAVDSIPAVFAITTDPFIVLTSNLFAILGLRAMYFLLAGAAERF